MDEQNISIDINTTKLLEWLISRRHVDKNFQSNIVLIREKINSAIQDMPAHEGIVKLLSGQHINYFHCLKIIDILKRTEADTKNLFGRYGSQRMKDWQEIVQSYQQGNVYLAEAAQVVMRNVSYEVPSLKKQVAKLQQVQMEGERKLKELSKTESLTLNEFNTSCRQLGITGEHIRSELIEQLNNLPEIYERATKTIASVNPAVELYSAFVSFHLGKDKNIDLLLLLKYLIKHGNTTTYEYTYNEKPVSIEILKLNITEADEDNDNHINSGDDEEIDFGDLQKTDGTNIDADFVGAPANEGDIDWGNLITAEDDFEIVDHSDLDAIPTELGIVIENSGLDGGVAKGNDAYTVLDNPETQKIIVDDLMELNAFLTMRLYEMGTESDLLSMSQIDAPTVLQMQTLESLTAMSDCVKTALAELTDKKVQHLHNVKHSPKYVDMLTATLKQKLNIVNRVNAGKKILESKIVEARREAKRLEPVISTIVEKTKELQKEIEDEISAKYKGRPVNITGGINML